MHAVLRCSFCNLDFKNGVGFSLHFVSHHNNGVDNGVNKAAAAELATFEALPVPPLATNAGPPRCSCPLEFKTVTDLFDHMISHHYPLLIEALYPPGGPGKPAAKVVGDDEV